MRGEFADVGWAVTWIGEQVLWNFPGAEGDLFLDERGPFHPKRHHGEIKILVPLYVDFCSKMTHAWVSYEPDHPYGIVSKVVGHCDCPYPDCGRHCRKYDERPHALLTITKAGPREYLLGGYRGLGEGAGI